MSIKLDVGSLPLDSEFQNGNQRDLQISFDKDFATLSDREQASVKALLSKTGFNKDETSTIRKMFEKHRGALSFSASENMEEDRVDYSNLDQRTKRLIATEVQHAQEARNDREMAVAQAEISENKHADRIAELISEFSQNERGETLANVHTCEGFQEVYDNRGRYLERSQLERRKEMAAGMTNNLFQRVYYAKGLLLDDERKLRDAFNSQKGTYETSVMAAQGAMFVAYWPLTYRLALRVRPGSVALWTAAYVGGYKMAVEPMLAQRFQSSLNGVASKFASKYGVIA